MLTIRRSNMTDDAGAMIFLFGAIILPIVGVITLVLWMILHQREYSKKKKEGKNEEVSNKQVLISLLIAIIGVAGFLLAIDDIAAFLNN
jgi:heme/copper-type cytochrome/quinol oxidase subunit 2